jgi:hypothetical protein
LVGATVLLILGAVILFVAAFSEWWTLTETASGGPVRSESFLPGSQYLISCSGTNCANAVGSFSYASGNLGAVGGLYEAAQALLIVAGVLALLAAALALLGVLGRGYGRRRYLVACFSGLLAVGLSLGAFAAVTGFQTSALAQDAGGIPSVSPSPVSSFWGSCSASSGGSNGICQSTLSGATVSATWGPAAGWVLGVVGAVLLLIGFLLLVRTRPTRGAAREYGH